MSEFTFWQLAKATATLLLIGVALLGAGALLMTAAGLPYVP
jgi:hypothetical protein